MPEGGSRQWEVWTEHFLRRGRVDEFGAYETGAASQLAGPIGRRMPDGLG
jgi:hypothetical protein